MMPDTHEILWRDLLTFLSPSGQRQIVEFVQRARRERGHNWLVEIKTEFPLFSFLVELVALRTAEEAFLELQSAYPNYPLAFVKSSIIELHQRLRREIEKERF
jgi:hypothetical protein